MLSYLLTIVLFAAAPSAAVYSPVAPPRQPAAYPGTEQLQMISGSFLTGTT
jgi:hypothetical protein